MQGLSVILWRSLKNTRLQKFIRKQPIVSARNWALSQPMILPSQSELLAACRGYQTGRRLGNRGGQCFEMLCKMEDFHMSHLVFFDPFCVLRLCTRTSALLWCNRHGAQQHSKGLSCFWPADSPKCCSDGHLRSFDLQQEKYTLAELLQIRLHLD